MKVHSFLRPLSAIAALLLLALAGCGDPNPDGPKSPPATTTAPGTAPASPGGSPSRNEATTKAAASDQ